MEKERMKKNDEKDFIYELMVVVIYDDYS